MSWQVELHVLSHTNLTLNLTFLRSLKQERQSVHLQRFLETEKWRNKTWRLHQHLSSVMEGIEDFLRQSYHGNQGAMNLAR